VQFAINYFFSVITPKVTKLHLHLFDQVFALLLRVDSAVNAVACYVRSQPWTSWLEFCHLGQFNRVHSCIQKWLSESHTYD